MATTAAFERWVKAERAAMAEREAKVPGFDPTLMRQDMTNVKIGAGILGRGKSKPFTLGFPVDNTPANPNRPYEGLLAPELRGSQEPRSLTRRSQEPEKRDAAYRAQAKTKAKEKAKEKEKEQARKNLAPVAPGTVPDMMPGMNPQPNGTIGGLTFSEAIEVQKPRELTAAQRTRIQETESATASHTDALVEARKRAEQGIGRTDQTFDPRVAVTRETKELTEDEYNALDENGKSRVLANTLLTEAISKDKELKVSLDANNDGRITASEGGKAWAGGEANYRKAYQDVFGTNDDRGFEPTFAPNTLAALSAMSVDRGKYSLDDVLAGDLNTSSKELASGASANRAGALDDIGARATSLNEQLKTEGAKVDGYFQSLDLTALEPGRLGQVITQLKNQLPKGRLSSLREDFTGELDSTPQDYRLRGDVEFKGLTDEAGMEKLKATEKIIADFTDYYTKNEDALLALTGGTGKEAIQAALNDPGAMGPLLQSNGLTGDEWLRMLRSKGLYIKPKESQSTSGSGYSGFTPEQVAQATGG